MVNAREEFKGRVAQLVAGGATREAAVQQVTRADPDLHRRLLAEANPGKPTPAYWDGARVFADGKPLK